MFDEDYLWHDLARAWQTPEIGEAAVAQMVGAPVAEAAERLSSRGISPSGCWA